MIKNVSKYKKPIVSCINELSKLATLSVRKPKFLQLENPFLSIISLHNKQCISVPWEVKPIISNRPWLICKKCQKRHVFAFVCVSLLVQIGFNFS